MTVIDAGPLVALNNRNDPNHARCLSALPRLRGPLIATWHVVTEAMHLLGRDVGWPGQSMLIDLIADGRIEIAAQGQREAVRMRELLLQYRDVPMSVADASIIVAAERSGARCVFTVDSDFRVYRINGRDHCEVVP